MISSPSLGIVAVMSLSDERETMVVYRAYIHLGGDEWGNELMCQVADAYAAEHCDKRPLIVTVHEHAGWFLSFLYGAPGIANGANIAEPPMTMRCCHGR